MKSRTTLSTLALIVPALLFSTCRCLNRASGPLNRRYIRVYPVEFANYKVSWRNLTSLANSTLTCCLRLPHPVVIPPHTDPSDYRYMVKLAMTSDLYCLDYRALTHRIRGLHQTHHEPLRTAKEDARSEVFWVRVTSVEGWLARLFSSGYERRQQFLSLLRRQRIVGALLNLAEDPNP